MEPLSDAPGAEESPNTRYYSLLKLADEINAPSAPEPTPIDRKK